MQYLLMIYSDERAFASATPAEIQPVMAAYLAYTEAMIGAGAYVGGNRLQPARAATTVRVADGQTKVLDGPYAETREQLGGYYLIEAADLDAAIAWAARCPGAALGVVEVRPVMPMPA